MSKKESLESIGDDSSKESKLYTDKKELKNDSFEKGNTLTKTIKEITDNVLSYEDSINNFDFDGALEVLDDMLKLDNTDLNLIKQKQILVFKRNKFLEIKGDLFIEKGSILEGLKCYTLSFLGGNCKTSFVSKIILLCFNLGKYKKGHDICSVGLKLDPNNLTLLELESKYYSYTGNYSNSLDCINKCLLKDSDSVKLLVNKSTYLFKLKLYDEALIVIDGVLKNNSELGKLWQFRGDILSALGNSTYGLSYYKAINYGSLNLKGYECIGDKFLADNRLIDSLSAYVKYLTIEPDNFNICNNIGYIYDMLGEYENSITYYKRSIVLNEYQIIKISNKFKSYILKYGV